MGVLLGAGIAVTLAGLGLLALFVIKVLGIKNRGLEGAEMSKAMQGLIPLNLGAVCLSAVGLIMVIMALFFG